MRIETRGCKQRRGQLGGGYLDSASFKTIIARQLQALGTRRPRV